jgi:predicted HicB family RNase H-like nuclease
MAGKPTNRSTFPLRLPASLREQIAELAKRDGISVNHFIAIALTEKVSRMTLRDKKSEPIRQR